MANTPMSSLAGTPTAGQSPRMQRSRWSHRSSSGTTLEMVLGPINEEHQEEEEEEGAETDGGQLAHRAPEQQPITTNSQVWPPCNTITYIFFQLQKSFKYFRGKNRGLT